MAAAENDRNTPSWLSSEPRNEALENSFTGGEMTKPLSQGLDQSEAMMAAAAPGNTGASGENATAPPRTLSSGMEDDDKELPGVILTMRLANMAAAGGLIACSILLMTTIPSVSAFVLAIYATCGSLLICCLETQLRFLRVMIAVNFGFLFNSVWRFAFYLLLGSIAWSFGNLFGKIVAIAFTAVAVFNTYVLCRYPSYRTVREKIAEEEDKRIEARISKEVKRQAVQQFTAGR